MTVTHHGQLVPDGKNKAEQGRDEHGVCDAFHGLYEISTVGTSGGMSPTSSATQGSPTSAIHLRMPSTVTSHKSPSRTTVDWDVYMPNMARPA